MQAGVGKLARVRQTEADLSALPSGVSTSVRRTLELGLEIPDSKLRKNDDGVWEYTEPDWDELRHVVTGHGPKTAERLELRRLTREQTEWVRRTVFAEAA